MYKENTLGDVIRKSRGKMSLRDFAERCGISHTHLDSIEKGYDPRTGRPVGITMETLEKILKVLDISFDDFIRLVLGNPNYIKSTLNPHSYNPEVGKAIEDIDNFFKDGLIKDEYVALRNEQFATSITLEEIALTTKYRKQDERGKQNTRRVVELSGRANISVSATSGELEVTKGSSTEGGEHDGQA